MDKDVSLILLLGVIKKDGGILLDRDARDHKLQELITPLLEDNLLSIVSTGYAITDIGQKVLQLFGLERKKITEPLERFKEVLVDGETVDGRIPIMAYTMLERGEVDAMKYLSATAVALAWNDMVGILSSAKQDSATWPKLLENDSLLSCFKGTVSADSWKVLGKTEEDAKRTAKWLLNPYPQNADLVQIGGIN